MLNEELVFEKLKSVKDPEINLNIVDLGLVYGVEISGEVVKVTMTMTSPMCPWGETLVSDVTKAVKELSGVKDAEIIITFDPPWDDAKMSEEAKLELGIS